MRLNQILHCTALDLLGKLPTGSVGAVVTDPPFHISIGRNSGPKGGFGVDPWTEVSQLDGVIDWTRPYAKECARVIRPGGALVVMGGTQSLAGWDVCSSKYGFQWMAEIIVLWNTGKPRAKNFGSLHTRVIWYSRLGLRHHAFNSEQRSIYSNILVCRKKPAAQRLHPSEKPVGLTNFIISVLTEENDLVVDPFAGSGSTLVSAELCGRPWLGAEENAAHFAQAASRLDFCDEEEVDKVHLWINGKLREV